MDNTLTIGEIKRRGMAAIEERLQHGPVHIIKRNRPTAVVISEAEYRRLAGASTRTGTATSAVQWLLSQPAAGQRDKAQIDASLSEERDW